MTISNEIADVLVKVGQSIKKVGYKRTINALDNLARVDSKCELVKDYIINLVCESKSVELGLLNKSYLNRNFSYCRDLIILLIKNNTKTTHEQVCLIFNIKKATISKLLKKFECMDEKIKHEKVFLDDYNEFNLKIQEYKQQLV